MSKAKNIKDDRIHPNYDKAMKKMLRKLEKETKGMSIYQYFQYLNKNFSI